MARSFQESTTAVLDGHPREDLTQRLRSTGCVWPACTFMKQVRFERMVEVVVRRLTSVTVVLENLADTHNCSAVLRTAEGLGLDAVHVVEQPRRFRKHHQILRGADRWITVNRHSSISTCLAQLRKDGFTTWAADIGPGCTPLEQIDIQRPTAIIMGTEKDGLTEEARSLADHRFTIPMYGFTGSLNVSVSAAVALSQTCARRRAQLPHLGDLNEEQAVLRLQTWLDREFERRGSSRRVDANWLLRTPQRNS